MIIGIELVLFLLFAALMATIVRMYDAPISEVSIKPFLIAYLSSLIAAIMAIWMMDSQGVFVIGYASFIVVAGSAVGGLAFVRALIEKVSPTKSE